MAELDGDMTTDPMLIATKGTKGAGGRFSLRLLRYFPLLAVIESMMSRLAERADGEAPVAIALGRDKAVQAHQKARTELGKMLSALAKMRALTKSRREAIRGYTQMLNLLDTNNATSTAT